MLALNRLAWLMASLLAAGEIASLWESARPFYPVALTVLLLLGFRAVRCSLRLLRRDIERSAEGSRELSRGRTFDVAGVGDSTGLQPGT